MCTLLCIMCLSNSVFKTKYCTQAFKFGSIFKIKFTSLPNIYLTFEKSYIASDITQN